MCSCFPWPKLRWRTYQIQCQRCRSSQWSQLQSSSPRDARTERGCALWEKEGRVSAPKAGSIQVMLLPQPQMESGCPGWDGLWQPLDSCLGLPTLHPGNRSILDFWNLSGNHNFRQSVKELKQHNYSCFSDSDNFQRRGETKNLAYS